MAMDDHGVRRSARQPAFVGDLYVVVGFGWGSLWNLIRPSNGRECLRRILVRGPTADLDRRIQVCLADRRMHGGKGERLAWQDSWYYWA